MLKKVRTIFNVCLSVATFIVSTLSLLPNTQLKAEKTKTFPSLFFHGLMVKKLRVTVVLPNLLQRFSASELASLCLSLDLQTHSNTCYLGKQKTFSPDFAMFY